MFTQLKRMMMWLMIVYVTMIDLSYINHPLFGDLGEPGDIGDPFDLGEPYKLQFCPGCGTKTRKIYENPLRSYHMSATFY
ncbi:hypothetical protein RRG08_021842 [Elysia crispata]|uniref:LITAF domain-containing protein n=1 Tax=Elysia crispata TaxID=231223 RepID=A0AAE1A025_9GAST|nr:hypothetical protein RRG08_021842 [Elysia crispata]